jgi:hypothetical protein
MNSLGQTVYTTLLLFGLTIVLIDGVEYQSLLTICLLFGLVLHITISISTYALSKYYDIENSEEISFCLF